MSTRGAADDGFSGSGRTRSVRRISRRGTNSQRIAMVNEISRRIERGEMTPDMAKAELERARRMPGFSQRTMLIAYALAAASFGLLFCGGAGTFAVTFVIGLLVQAVLPLLRRFRWAHCLQTLSAG